MSRAKSDDPAALKSVALPVDDTLSVPKALKQSYTAVYPQMMALDRKLVSRVTVNARETARLLLARIAKINEIRPQIFVELPKHPIHCHD